MPERKELLTIFCGMLFLGAVCAWGVHSESQAAVPISKKIEFEFSTPEGCKVYSQKTVGSSKFLIGICPKEFTIGITQ